MSEVVEAKQLINGKPFLIEVLCNNVRFATALIDQGCDCYAYGLLASGYCDLVVESGLEPCDYLPLIPVVTGAGGWITDWNGRSLGLGSGDRVIAAATKPLLDTAIHALAAS